MYQARSYTTLKLSIRIPPSFDQTKTAKILTEKLTAKPLPFNANVEFDCGGHLANGFNKEYKKHQKFILMVKQHCLQAKRKKYLHVDVLCFALFCFGFFRFVFIFF